MPRPSSRQEARVGAFLRQVGATDLRVWLGISHDTPPREAVNALERKRQTLEAALSDPKRAREAEFLLDYYQDLRRALAPPATRSEKTVAPDYYAMLGVSPGASFADIERAWRAAQTDGRDNDAAVAQAWRVLGDPLNRAHFDRSRREAAAAASPSLPFVSEPDPPTSPTGSPASAHQGHPPGSSRQPGARAVFASADLREVEVSGNAATTLAIPFVVRGGGRWSADILTDHPCMSTRPYQTLDVVAGRHTLTVRFDPALMAGDPALVDRYPLSGSPPPPIRCSITIVNPDEQHTLVFRVRHLRAPSPHQRLQHNLTMAGVGVLLVLLGWWLGARTTVQPVQHLPASEGVVAQIPSASACLSNGPGPLPSWIDVHTDGLGRPTGFSFGGSTSPDLERCVKDALVRLSFPPTPDGLPAFHRYRIPQDSP